MDTQVASVTSTEGRRRGMLARLGTGGVMIGTLATLVAALVTWQVLMHNASTGREMRATSLSNQDFIAQQDYREESTSAAGTVASYRTINGATYYDQLTGKTVVDAPATTTEQRTSYRVSASYYYVPAAGGMWEVIHVQADGLPVIEDYVSGPPPANGTVITP